MRAVVIRVSKAAIAINGEQGGAMGRGLLVLVGIKSGDGEAEAALLAKKCAELRVFEDENGKMNKSLADVNGSLMVVSNFTLYADCSHGRRPDFFGAAGACEAIPVYQRFLSLLEQYKIPIITGEFGADMQIDHVNDGPVTLIMDTEQMIKK